jgi:hypothetical protein
MGGEWDVDNCGGGGRGIIGQKGKFSLANIQFMRFYPLILLFLEHECRMNEGMCILLNHFCTNF